MWNFFELDFRHNSLYSFIALENVCWSVVGNLEKNMHPHDNPQSKLSLRVCKHHASIVVCLLDFLKKILIKHQTKKIISFGLTPILTTIPDCAKNLSTTMLLRSVVHHSSSSSLSLSEAPSLPLSLFTSSLSSSSSSIPRKSISLVPSSSESPKITLYLLKLICKGSTYLIIIPLRLLSIWSW